jgi:hypothetical protein
MNMPKYTLIDDLKDISEISDTNKETNEQITKFIRKQMPNPPNQSGMASTNYGNGQKFNHDKQPDFYPDVYDQQENKLPVTLYCLDVHSHIQSCPICSRFFKQDNSLYIIAIIILSIICIMLLKKVLNL